MHTKTWDNLVHFVKWRPFNTLEVSFFNMQPFPMAEVWFKSKAISWKKSELM